MPRNSILLALFFAPAIVFLVPAAKAQDSLSTIRGLQDYPDSVFIIGDIYISGNSQTKDFVIRRELSLKTGDFVTRKAIEYDQNRIYSLGLFNEVQIKVIPGLDSVATLIIAVRERWFVFPFPIVGIKDRDWSKWYYGFGVVHTNFRGRAEKVYVTAVFGYDPSFRLSYRNPFLDEEGSEYLEFNAGYNRVRNRSLEAQTGVSNNFDEIHVNAGLTLGKRLGLTHTLWISGAYESVSIPDVTPAKTISPSGTDSYPVFGAGYGYDSRDLKEYPNYGAYVRFTATKFGLPGADYDFIRYAGDMRKYVPIVPRVVLGGRAFTDLAAGGVAPTYNHTFFGYNERIRGHFNDVMEGESIMGASAELRYTLFDPIYIHVDFLPQEFSVWRFCMAITGYGDAGMVWFRGTPVALDRFAKGYGVGINYLLPYSIVLRTEYAFNEVRRGEFIIDVGASF